MVRGTKLSVNFILNVIEVCFRFFGTHFDHNQNIIKILFFAFPIGPYEAMYKFQTPRTGGCCDLIQTVLTSMTSHNPNA